MVLGASGSISARTFQTVAPSPSVQETTVDRVGNQQDDSNCSGESDSDWQLDCATTQLTSASTVDGSVPAEIAALVQPPARHPIQDDIFYFVMPDRFANGDPTNDRGGIAGDRLDHGFDPTDFGFFHGGDLAGLTSKLDYLDDMGITAIWMTPVFKNNPVQGSGADVSAGYHGYWYTDMTQFDPHFGTNAELETLIDEAHSRDIKIFFDIITNHTADILTYEEGSFAYRNRADFPYLDADGATFDDRDFANSVDFPELDAETSFPYTPAFDNAGDESVKVPAWLNNPIYYHNRGNSSFSGENSLYGDFFGLDDLFTEHPDVVSGMIDIYKDWISNYEIDGFRVDTVKHVNVEFWEQFVPAILAHAEAEGRDDFFIFGEVFSGNEQLLSYYTSQAEFPAVLDFKFQEGIRSYVSGGASSDTLENLFEADDYYTDADSNAYSLPTFIGNHDRGRFAHFLDVDNGGALNDGEKAARIRLAHALMYFARGVPVVYYGDEQGFVGDGDDKNARQDMFPSQVDSYNDDDLVGTDATTADDNFDTTHPLYVGFGNLAQVIQENPALQTGAQIHRYSLDSAGVYAFSRIDRDEQVEYIVAVNNSDSVQDVAILTYYGDLQEFSLVADGGYEPADEGVIALPPTVSTEVDGRLPLTVRPHGYTVYKANAPIPASEAAPSVSFSSLSDDQEVTLETYSLDGNDVPQRLEVAVDLSTEQFAEVTFAVRPSDAVSYTVIGVDDNPPYRLFYDASDLSADATLDLVAIVNDLSASDLNGNLSYAEVTGISIAGAEPAPSGDYEYVAIHYLRDDGDYGDHTTGDFNDYWGLHLWGDAIDASEVTEWTTPKPFLGETDYGRMALIKMSDSSQDVNFIVHKGDTKDGTDADRSFNPAADGPEIWLKQDDGDFYTSQAAAQGFVTIHYQRADGDYGDPTSDDFNNFWGLHLWGDGLADGVGTEWTTPRKPDGSDDFGAFWQVPIQDASQPVNFIIHKGDDKDPGPDQSLNPQENAGVWITSGNETIFEQEGAAANVVTIHYQRADGDYGDPASDDFNDFWGLHVWDGAANPNPSWQEPVKPAGTDAFGIYWQIPLTDDATQLAYIIHKGDEKDPGPDQFLNIGEDGYEVWQFEGADPETPYAYPIQGATGPSTGGGDLSTSRAHWLTEDTLVWEFPGDGSGNVTLFYAETGGMTLENGVMNGADGSLPLFLDSDGLSDELKAKFPHLANLTVYKIPDISDYFARIPDVLKGQMAIAFTASTDSGGVVEAATGVQIPGVLDDLYAYDGLLGPEFQEPPLTLGPVDMRLWAPTARSVKLHLFLNADDAEAEAITEMTVNDSGVWEATIQEIWIGKYYLYEVEVYVPSTGQIETNIVTDPYSLGLAMNSAKSLLVNLDDPAVQPEGWESLTKPTGGVPNDYTLYELHMRDFSANDATVSEANRGKFTAFTEVDSDGMKHLKKLADAGLSHVHLLPVFDIATINEDPTQRQEPNIPEDAGPASDAQANAVEAVRDLDAYNWGYDPFHYTVPEGSYSTDPNGAARILEFRQMVQALNDIGLRVVMDVVYNHTHAAGQDEKSVLDKIVPGYYHRLDENGNVTTSTCCANTASEHAMMEKLMVDSLKVWAEHYKVDGFRFDLMGHHMKSNMLTVQEALTQINPAIYIYGEGWNFGEVVNNARGENATQFNMGGTGIGTFNDRLRDAVRGGGPFDSGQDLITNQGFSNGLYSNPNGNNDGSNDEKAELLQLTDIIRVGMAGNLADFEFESADGSVKKGSEIDYNGSPAGYTQSPQEHIIYVSAHDNQTLFDNNVYKLPADASVKDRVTAQKLGAAITLLSQGVPFIHAGVEMLRSKSLERDSYNSGDWFNRLHFDYSANNFGVGLPVEAGGDAALMAPFLENESIRPGVAAISEMVDYVETLLSIRASSPLFRLQSKEEVMNRVRFHNTGPEQIPGVIVMSIADGPDASAALSGANNHSANAAPMADLDPNRNLLIVAINATQETQTITIPEFSPALLQPLLEMDDGESTDSPLLGQGAADELELTMPAGGLVVLEEMQLSPTELGQEEEPTSTTLPATVFLPTIQTARSRR